MIPRPRRSRSYGLLGVIALAVALPAGHAQEAAPATAAVEIILTTTTPLGEAGLRLPAGSVVTGLEEDGAMIVLRQGPFIARVPREAIVFPAEPPAPEPSPNVIVAEAIVDPVEAVALAEDAPAAPAAVGPWDAAWAGDWKAIWPAGAALLLGGYSLLATVALVRLRRRGQPVPAPARQTRPAVVTDGGRSIECPLCGKNIVVENLSGGRNTCPACHGSFICDPS